MKKPAWVVEKERARKAAAAETVWLFGLHAVRDALANPAREKLRLVLTKNAADRLGEAVAAGGLAPEIVDARKFDTAVPIDRGSVHQGAALEVRPLAWGSLAEVCAGGAGRPLVVLLDRVTDPHNVGAILRSAEVFGYRAVCLPARGTPGVYPSVVKISAGASEHLLIAHNRSANQYARAAAEAGYSIAALDAKGDVELADLARQPFERMLLVIGGEDKSVGQYILNMADCVVRIGQRGRISSLNASVSAAIALHALQGGEGGE